MPHHPDQEEAQVGPVGDHDHSGEQDREEGEGRQVELDHRLVEPVAREEEVHPHGRGAVADLHVGQEDDAEVDEIDAVSLGDGDDEGHHDHQSREDVEHTAQHQEEEVEDDEKPEPALNVRPRELEELRGHVGGDEVVGRGHGDPKYDEDAPHQDHAVAHHSRQVPQPDVPVDSHFHHQGIKSGHGRGFAYGEIAGVDAPQDDDG